MKSGFNKQEIYEILTRIPRGNVTTYGQIAERLGNKCYARAVGKALHCNPDGDKYPCYKVVNSRGKLSSNYAFGGIEEQKRRLEADGIRVENNKVDLKIFGMKILND
ncbi:MAG: MGMT family protein [Clostridia bacterium]|nr:MGMT family protein [Clostridia bacterium]